MSVCASVNPSCQNRALCFHIHVFPILWCEVLSGIECRPRCFHARCLGDCAAVTRHSVRCLVVKRPSLGGGANFLSDRRPRLRPLFLVSQKRHIGLLTVVGTRVVQFLHVYDVMGWMVLIFEWSESIGDILSSTVVGLTLCPPFISEVQAVLPSRGLRQWSSSTRYRVC